MLDRIQQIVDQRVHRLSAFDNLVDIKVLEELGKTCAEGNCNKSVLLFGFVCFFFRRLGKGLISFFQFPLHGGKVIDFDLIDLCKFNTVIKCESRIVCMQVYFCF